MLLINNYYYEETAYVIYYKINTYVSLYTSVTTDDASVFSICMLCTIYI